MPRKSISVSTPASLTPEQLEKGVMEVKVTGTPEAVSERMGLTQEAAQGQPQAASDADEFAKHLRNPKYLVRVKRISPRIWEGRRVNLEVYTQECPLTLQDIQEEVFGQHGGRKFRVAVVDPESGQTVAARVIENDADPILPDTGEEEEGERMIFEAAQPDAGQMSEQILDQQAKIAAKQLQVETLQQQLEAVRAKRASAGKHDPAIDHKIEMLERQLSEAKYAQEVERIQRESQQKIEMLQRRIEELTAKINQPAQAQENSLLARLIEDSNRRFDAMMAQMRDDRLNSILHEIAALKNTPSREGSALKDVVEIVEMVDRIREGGSENEEEDDEDRPWYVKLADKYLPRLFDLIEEDRKAGKPVPSKEELVRRIEEEADRAVKEEMARRRALQQQAQAAALPPPPPSTGAVPPSPPPPSSLSPQENASSAASTVTVDKLPSIEDEIKLRAGQVMTVINREMMLRPREYNWNYVAFQGLPESLLEKVANAPDPVAMIAAFEGVLNPAGLEQLKHKVASEPKLAAWLGRGLKELKEWWDKAQADPDFDPGEEGDEEPGDAGERE